MRDKLYRMKQARTYGLTSLILKNSALTHLTNSQLWLLAGLSETRPVAEGEVICKAGTVPECAYIIKSGMLRGKMKRRQTNGVEQ